MVLTDEQTDELYCFAQKHDLYGTDGLLGIIALARYEKQSIVVNADW